MLIPIRVKEIFGGQEMDYTFDYSRTFDDEKDDLIEKFNSYEKFIHEKSVSHS